MKKLLFFAALCLLICCGCSTLSVISASGTGTDVTITDLRCEYLVNPLGIDVVKPRLSWILQTGQRGQKQTSYQVIVSSSRENIEAEKGDLWDSGKVKSPASTQIEYKGKPLTSGIQCWWKARIWDKDGKPTQWSEPATWSMGLLEDKDWAGAQWIGGDSMPDPWLCKEVDIKAKPERVTAYVCSLGYYELYVNGKKVDDYVLSPAVSDFSKRAYYIAHDVTKYLVAGKNSIGIWLGRGWYRNGIPGVVHSGPLVRAAIIVEGKSSEPVNIITDESWKAKQSYMTPIGGWEYNNYGGEQYDARLESDDWNKVGTDRTDWIQAQAVTPAQKILSAQMVQANAVTETLKPVSINELGNGQYQVDMGKNYVGWLDVNFAGQYNSGDQIRIDYGDFKDNNNRLTTFSQRDIYIASGKGNEHFRSRFNYHAFRWVNISGLKAKPSPEQIKGYMIRTDYDSPSSFQCSNELLDRIYDTAKWTYECLSLGGYVVDCPHRERLGYGGDAGTSIETAMFDFDTSALYTKWLGNWRDAQIETGDLPYTVPWFYSNIGGGGPMWCGFIVTAPWQLYVQYGDKHILEVMYPNIQKWLTFLKTKTKDNVLEFYKSYAMSDAQWNFLGDWVTPIRQTTGQSRGRRNRGGNSTNASVDNTFINNCHYLYTVELAAKIANILDRDKDAEMYKSQAETLKKAIHERFYDADNYSYASGVQPYLAFPLLVDIVPAELKQKVMKNLEDTILVKNTGHIDAGMHGTYFLLKYLMEQDRNDLIFEMVDKKDYPSWGDMLEQGATTFWENWSGRSHIHDTLISVGSWFVQGVGGIRIDENKPGFKHAIIKPGIVGDLKWAKTQYPSIAGMFTTNWKIDGSMIQVDVTVPPNSTATVYLPQAKVSTVTEGGVDAEKAKYVKYAGMEADMAVYEIASGTYTFKYERLEQLNKSIE